MDKQLVRRILMSALGVVICGISVGMFKYAALGVDPFQSLMSGLDAVIPIGFGTLYVIVNLVLLCFALMFDRKKIGLATLINLLLLGYIAEYSQALTAIALPDAGLPARLILLAGYSRGQVFGVVNIGTVVTAFFMGPLIEFFNVHLARPFLYGHPKAGSSK